MSILVAAKSSEPLLTCSSRMPGGFVWRCPRGGRCCREIPCQKQFKGTSSSFCFLSVTFLFMMIMVLGAVRLLNFKAGESSKSGQRCGAKDVSECGEMQGY